MATPAFQLKDNNTSVGSRRYQVTSGTTASISAGTPVVRTLGSQYVAAAADGTPVVGTDYLVGFAVSNSTETASAAGYVDVEPIMPNQVWLGAPKVAASWDTQSEYNALVGDRVVFDLTATAWTVDATDSANNGLVVEDLDITKYPGKVAFSVRNGALYTA
jgi:hypothetical protein